MLANALITKNTETVGKVKTYWNTYKVSIMKVLIIL